ncbi:MAG: tRNA-dihydrouridine synthase [Candidatus Parcubacteria bacterium]|nr:MAG: tRNA-dihydrouridine synthase [Candidatus Parcubacteria bacterium]
MQRFVFGTPRHTPWVALAPMADATDPAFRRLVASYAPPTLMWTEFISADGLWHLVEREGRRSIADNPLLADLQYSEEERPIVAQLFGANPTTMRYAARVAADLGFDGVDINMGCPDRAVLRQGAGAALIREPNLAHELVEAAREGSGLPVSVKTRLGVSRDILEKWLPHLLRSGAWMVTLHARTARELSRVPARWERVRDAARLRDQLAPLVAVVGNGDITSLQEAQERAQEAGADGAMVGRAALGAPWFFSGAQDVSLAKRLEALARYCELFCALVPHKPFSKAQRMFKAFLRGVPHSKELLLRLLATASAQEAATLARRAARESCGAVESVGQ